jgi:hypothetical protein
MPGTDASQFRLRENLLACWQPAARARLRGGSVRTGIARVALLYDAIQTCSLAPADTQTSFAGGLNAAAFFLTNSCKLIGPCPVNMSTSSDIRS